MTREEPVEIKDALDTAIVVETELYDRYTRVADMMQGSRTMGVAVLFRNMASKQKSQIAELATERHERFGDEPSTIDVDVVLSALEEPDFSKLGQHMSPPQALRAILHCERRIRGYFLANLDRTGAGEARALFQRLARTDMEHEDVIRQELARVDGARSRTGRQRAI